MSDDFEELRRLKQEADRREAAADLEKRQKEELDLKLRSEGTAKWLAFGRSLHATLLDFKKVEAELGLQFFLLEGLPGQIRLPDYNLTVSRPSRNVSFEITFSVGYDFVKTYEVRSFDQRITSPFPAGKTFTKGEPEEVRSILNAVAKKLIQFS